MGVAWVQEQILGEGSKHSSGVIANTYLQVLDFSMLGHSHHLQAGLGSHVGGEGSGRRFTSFVTPAKSLILLCLCAASMKWDDSSTHLAELR